MRWPPPDGPWLVELEWAEVSGRAEPVAFTLRSVEHQRSVKAGDLRAIPLGQIAADCRAGSARRLHKLASDHRSEADLRREFAEILRLHGEPPGDPSPDAPGGRRVSTGAAERAALYEAPPRRPGGRPQEYDNAHWAGVAAVYTHAGDEGRPPTKAVAERWFVSRSAAGKWVARCRTLGLLAPTTQGKPNSTRRKS